jgi:hypothetical protein
MIPSIGIWGLGCYTIVTSYPFFNWQLRAAPPITIIWAFNFFGDSIEYHGESFTQHQISHPKWVAYQPFAMPHP